MSRGRVVRFNENTGHGRIEDSSGGYSVRAEDMASNARVEGAFVEFDVESDKPHDRAVNVRLRKGTRNAPTQRRFGDTD